MRTTLTLDRDVAAKLTEASRRSGKTFKAVVNEALRIGLDGPKAPRPSQRFTVKARALGLQPGVSVDNVEALLERLERP